LIKQESNPMDVEANTVIKYLKQQVAELCVAVAVKDSQIELLTIELSRVTNGASDA
jgi:hypothetical protein